MAYTEDVSTGKVLLRLFVLVGFAYLFFGCTYSYIEPTVDASIVDSYVWEDPHPCNQETVDRDFFNCGECSNSCPAKDSDNCGNGECRCGLGSTCPDGSDCRYGRCIPYDPNGEVGCEFDTVCGAGFGCIEAHCTRIECVQEECDGVDNDCDGTVDGIGTMPLSQFCLGSMHWDQDPESVLLPCGVGVRACLEGSWSECHGDTPPQAEVGRFACDGQDNDCDGCIDGSLTDIGTCVLRPPSGYDIVYVIDLSGSMSGTIEAVQEASATHAATLGSSVYRFGIAVIGLPESPFFGRVSDLGSLEDLQQDLTMLHLGSGHIEPSWNAVESIGLGTTHFSWREGSLRLIVLFTDEPGQQRSSSENAMCASMTHGENFAAVVNLENASDFDDCGRLYPLTDDAVEMAANLLTIIEAKCE